MSTKAISLAFKILVFFSPIIFVANTHELFEFPKMYFVYGLGTTTIWLFLIKKIWLKEKIKPPNVLILLFLTSYVISTIFSDHIYTSVWGYYTRFNGGLISVLVFIGLYTVIINEFNKEKIRNLIRVALLSLIPISAYAILQHYGYTSNIWGDDATVRAFSTFGQPNWLAAYLAMLLPTVIHFTLNEKGYLWIATYLLTFSALWFTQSLSGMLGFILGLIVLVLLNKEKIVEKKNIFSFLIIASLTIALFNPGIFTDKIRDVFYDVTKLRQVRASETTEQSNVVSDPGFIRGALWKGTINLVTSSPKIIVMGTGPETFAYSFQKFRPKELNYSSEWNFVLNKPHNYYLELMVSLGRVGFIFYSLMVAFALLKKNPFYVPGLVVLLTTNIFGWPTVAAALLFWIFLAGINKEA